MLLACFSILLIYILSACGNVKTNDAPNEEGINEQAARELGKEFIDKLYTVEEANLDLENIEAMLEYQNDFSIYLTDDEFEELASKRFFLIPQEAAEKQQCTISVHNIEIKISNVGKESVDFDHQFILEFTDEKGNEVNTIEMNGQMTVSKTDDGLKISRYYDSEFPVEMLNP